MKIILGLKKDKDGRVLWPIVIIPMEYPKGQTPENHIIGDKATKNYIEMFI